MVITSTSTNLTITITSSAAAHSPVSSSSSSCSAPRLAFHAQSPDPRSQNNPQPACRRKQNKKSGIFRVINFDHVAPKVNRMAVAQRLLVSMSCEAGTPHWTLTAAVLLGFLLGIVSAYPLPSGGRTNATLLEKRWETLFSRSVLGISGEKPELNWESDYLLGIKRVRRLYCNVGIGFHLQVLPDGRINGAHNENQYSLIEISTVERGVVSLYGMKSELFVAMNSRGRLYGTTFFHDECKFKESMLPNNYNAYESLVYRGSYIALSKHGRVKRGNKATTAMTVTHFLPRI